MNKEEITNRILDHINSIGYDNFLKNEQVPNNFLNPTDVLDIEKLKRYFGNDLKEILDITMKIAGQPDEKN